MTLFSFARRSLVTALLHWLLLTGGGFAGPSLAEAAWPRFRGTNGAGVSDATTVPASWEESDYNWVTELPGEGHSSPIVWGDRLFVTSADPQARLRYLNCLNTDNGAVIWRREFAYSRHKRHKNNSDASSTPVADEQRVYVLFHGADETILAACDHHGKEVWKRDLGPYRHGQGGASSPIIYQDLVIVANDHKQDSFLGAFDSSSGQPRRAAPREGKRACYATPCVFRRDGAATELIFTHCFEGVTGVDPATGKPLWVMDVFGREPQRAIGSPIVSGDLIVASSGARVADKHVVVLRRGEGAAVEEVYRIARSAPHVPTPLIHRDRLYLWSDQGIVTSVELSTGKRIWQKRVGGNYFSSPVCVGGRLYNIDLDGQVVVLAASDQFEKLGGASLGRPTHASPAVSDGVMYLRTLSHVHSVGGRDE